MVGDLNICCSHNLDTDRPDLLTDTPEPEAEVLQTFLKESALDDIFRFLHPTQKAYTHSMSGERQDQTQRRLDYVLGTHELVQPGTRMGIHTGYPLEALGPSPNHLRPAFKLRSSTHPDLETTLLH